MLVHGCGAELLFRVILVGGMNWWIVIVRMKKTTILFVQKILLYIRLYRTMKIPLLKMKKRDKVIC